MVKSHACNHEERREPAKPRVQPAGAGAVLEVQDRLKTRSASQGNNLVMQEQVDGQLVESSPHLSGLSPSTENVLEVGPQEIRRSGRQRSQFSPYQAGTGGMEKLDNKVQPDYPNVGYLNKWPHAS